MGTAVFHRIADDEPGGGARSDKAPVLVFGCLVQMAGVLALMFTLRAVAAGAYGVQSDGGDRADTASASLHRGLLLSHRLVRGRARAGGGGQRDAVDRAAKRAGAGTGRLRLQSATLFPDGATRATIKRAASGGC